MSCAAVKSKWLGVTFYFMRIPRLHSLFFFLAVFSALPAFAAKSTASLARNPYLSAIVLDANSGKVLFEDNADAMAYPASTTKLMTFLVVSEKIDFGNLTLQTPVTVDAETSHIGGTRVWLKEKEVFPVDDLLYAMMIQSANDAAYALAKQVAGSREAFVALMNEEAKKLGMMHTTFQSPHGLPPSAGQEHDVTTARDMALLGRELVRRETVLRYTSVKHRVFRPDSAAAIDMYNHDHLLNTLPGCDGLKTGYFHEAGFSIVVSVQRGGNRVIAVVMGSPDAKTRDKKARELVEQAFAKLPPVPAPPAAAKPASTDPKADAAPKPTPENPPTVKFKVPGKA